jgi:hypothetical protein
VEVQRLTLVPHLPPGDQTPAHIFSVTQSLIVVLLRLLSQIFNQMVAQFIKEDWSDACLKLVLGSNKLLKTCLTTCLKKALVDMAQASRYRRLEKFLLVQVEPTADEVFAEVRVQVDDFIRHHKIPYTQHGRVIEKKNELELERLSVSLEGPANTGGTAFEAISRIFKSKRKDVNLSAAEMIEDALGSYGEKVLDLFIDEIPHICMDVFRSFPKKMQKPIRAVGDEDLDRVLADSKDFVREYESLTLEAEELQAGLDIFYSIL